MSSIKLASGDIPGLLGYFTNNVERHVFSVMVHGYHGFLQMIYQQTEGRNELRNAKQSEC